MLLFISLNVIPRRMRFGLNLMFCFTLWSIPFSSSSQSCIQLMRQKESLRILRRPSKYGVDCKFEKNTALINIRNVNVVLMSQSECAFRRHFYWSSAYTNQFSCTHTHKYRNLFYTTNIVAGASFINDRTFT